MSIIERGIQGTNDFIEKGERPAVWFTFGKDFEPTAMPWNLKDGPRAIVSLEVADKTANGLVRIAVEQNIAPHTWTKWKNQSGVPSTVANALESSAIEMGAKPRRDWRCTFGTVCPKQWESIEVWSAGKWIPIWDHEAGLDLQTACKWATSHSRLSILVKALQRLRLDTACSDSLSLLKDLLMKYGMEKVAANAITLKAA